MCHFIRSLQRTGDKLVKHFGDQYAASKEIFVRLALAREDLSRGEQEYLVLLHSLSEAEALGETSSQDTRTICTYSRVNGGYADLGGMGVVILEGAWGVLDESAGQREVKDYVTLHHRLLKGVQRLTAVKNRGVIDTNTPVSAHLPYSPPQTLPLPPLPPTIDSTNEAVPSPVLPIINGNEILQKSPIEIISEPSSLSISSLIPITETPLRSIICISSTPLIPLTHTSSSEFAPLDSDSVLRTLALWQQQDNGRTVLLVTPGAEIEPGEGRRLENTVEEGLSLAGWVRPVKVKEEDENSDGDEVGWNDPRCDIRMIALGHMDLTHQAQVNPLYGFHSTCYPEPGSGLLERNNNLCKKRSNFLFYPDNVQDVCMRKSFWDVSFVLFPPHGRFLTPTGGLKLTTVTDLSNAAAKSINIDDSTSSATRISLVVGPIIGQITPTSAIIILETFGEQHIELRCIDEITGVQHCSMKKTTARGPCIFTFDNLAPNRAFDVYCADLYPSSSGGYNSSATNTPNNEQLQYTLTAMEKTPMVAMVRGTFTTPGELPLLIPPTDSEKKVIMQGDSEYRTATCLRKGLTDSIEGKKRAENEWQEKTKNEVGVEGEINGEDIDDVPIDTLSVKHSGDQGKEQIETSEIKNARLLASSDFPGRVISRIFVLGSNKPSRISFPGISHRGGGEDCSGDGKNRANEKSSLLRGYNMSRALVDVTSRAWGGVDLVVHVGYSVDLAVTVDRAVSLIVQAEHAAMNERSSSVSFTKNQAESYLLQAREQLRSAYTLHWGGSSVRSLLAHGSHLFVSDPTLDLINMFHASSMRQLTRDLGPFVTGHLLTMMRSLKGEYQNGLWSDGDVYGGSRGGRGVSGMKYLSGGLVGVFSLTSDRRGEHLLCEEQFRELSRALHVKYDGDDIHIENIGHFNEMNNGDVAYNYGRNGYDNYDNNHQDGLSTSNYHNHSRNTGIDNSSSSKMNLLLLVCPVPLVPTGAGANHSSAYANRYVAILISTYTLQEYLIIAIYVYIVMIVTLMTNILIPPIIEIIAMEVTRTASTSLYLVIMSVITIIAIIVNITINSVP